MNTLSKIQRAAYAHIPRPARASRQGGLAIWVVLLVVAVVVAVGTVMSAGSGSDGGRTSAKQNAVIAASVISQGAALAQSALLDGAASDPVNYAQSQAGPLASKTRPVQGAAAAPAGTPKVSNYAYSYPLGNSYTAAQLDALIGWMSTGEKVRSNLTPVGGAMPVDGPMSSFTSRIDAERDVQVAGNSASFPCPGGRVSYRSGFQGRAVLAGTSTSNLGWWAPLINSVACKLPTDKVTSVNPDDLGIQIDMATLTARGTNAGPVRLTRASSTLTSNTLTPGTPGWSAAGTGAPGTTSYFKLEGVYPAVCKAINTKRGLTQAATAALQLASGGGCAADGTYVSIYDKQL